jgi:hypothetical protein
MQFDPLHGRVVPPVGVEFEITTGSGVACVGPAFGTATGPAMSDFGPLESPFLKAQAGPEAPAARWEMVRNS